MIMRGFTLIEMMISLVVLGILGTLAAPSFVQYLASQRIRNASYDLMSALQMARSEAIKRNTAIDLKRTSTAWTSGWTVQVPGVTPTVLRTKDAYSGVTISDSANLSTVTYGNDGRATTATTVFKFQPNPTQSSITARCVTIGLSGVPSSAIGGC